MSSQKTDETNLGMVTEQVNISPEAVKDSIPRAVYLGELPIGDVSIDCAILDDGRRIISTKSIFEAFGRTRKGQNSRLEIDGTKLPPFIAAKNLEPFIDQSFIDRTKTVSYRDGGLLKTGYSASLLPKICGVYLAARRAGALTASQQTAATQAEILLDSLAQVGIDALVDEATGYQHDRKHDALRLLLAKYIAEGLQRWMHTFPDTFFAELDRLYGNEPTTARGRPQYYGRFINRYIYDPIEHGYVKKQLDELNIKEDGKRRARFHQWLSENGRSILIHQIGRVQMLMEMCSDIEKFRNTAEERKKISIAPYLFDEMNQIID